MANMASEWVKSSYSAEGQCVEWAPASVVVTGSVPVRDSKNPGGPQLVFGPGTWTAFVSSVGIDSFLPAS